MGRYFVTGNEFVSVPEIRKDASIVSINFLHVRYRGIVEISGRFRIKPVLNNSLKYKMDNLEWRYDNYWMPEFNSCIDNITNKRDNLRSS